MTKRQRILIEEINNMLMGNCTFDAMIIWSETYIPLGYRFCK